MPDKVAMVSGGFDPLHVGHIDLFVAAARRGRLIVALNSDKWLIHKKGYVFMSWSARARIIAMLRPVSEVVSVDDGDGTICGALRRYRPDFFCNGGDRKASDPCEEAACRMLGIVQLFNVGGGKVASSSALVEAVR